MRGNEAEAFHDEYQPSCRANGGQCSGCTLAYDCVRARSGRSFSWPLVAIVGALGIAALAKLVTG